MVDRGEWRDVKSPIPRDDPDDAGIHKHNVVGITLYNEIYMTGQTAFL